MPKCTKCNESFPDKIWIDGRLHSLNRRTKCFKCSPFNTRKKANEESQVHTIHCEKCKRVYTYKRSDRKGATRRHCGSCVVNIKRHQRKVEIVKYLGGSCSICGFDKSVKALHAHHVNPEEKSFTISGTHCLSWEKLKNELDKCILVCANCHADLHD